MYVVYKYHFLKDGELYDDPMSGDKLKEKGGVCTSFQ